MKIKRPVKLIELSSGRVQEATSVGEFCRDRGYSNNEKYHFTPLLNNERWMYKGWVLPETYEAVTEEQEWVDIYGNEYCLSIYQICRKLGLERTFTSIVSKFLMGERESIFEIYLKSTKRKFLNPKNYTVEYYEIEKEGKVVRGKNTTELQVKTGSCRTGFNRLFYGHSEVVCGWKIKNIKIKNKSIL